MSGIDPFVYGDPVQPLMPPGAARIVVWIALGSASWSILGAVLVVGIRLVG